MVRHTNHEPGFVCVMLGSLGLLLLLVGLVLLRWGWKETGEWCVRRVG